MAHFPGAMFVDFAPTTGQTITVPTADSGTPVVMVISGAGLLASLIIAFPASAPDGQLVGITSKNIITLVTITGTVQGTLTNLVANGAGGIYKFRLSNATWYRIA